MPPSPRRRQLIAVEHDVDLPRAQQGGQILPRSLKEPRLHAQLAGQQFGQLGLEADHQPRVLAGSG